MAKKDRIIGEDWENIPEQDENSVENLDYDENKEVSIEDTEDTSQELKETLEREKERYLRLFAEFENFKKRTGRERMELFKTAGQDVIVSMLPVMDDFERAMAEIARSGEEGLYKGIELIKNKLQETLRSKGLEQMGIEKGDTFNADRHEAITQIPAPTPDLKGKIIDVIEKGYTLGEKVIRYPKVIIGQ